MLKKTVLLTLVLILVMSLMPMTAAAQDDDVAMEACTPEQFQAVAESLGESFTEFSESMGEMSEEPTAEEWILAVVLLDAFTQGYWEGFSEMSESEEAMTICAEAYDMIFTFGLALDEALIIASLNAIAASDEMLGPLVQPLADAREEKLDESMTAYGETMTAMVEGEMEMPEALPACTEEELTATLEGIGILVETFQGLTETLEEDMLSAAAGLEALSTGYWETFYTVLPACAEAHDLGYNVGLIFDETLTIVLLDRVAEIATTNGDTETAEVLAESITTRGETLTAASEAYFADFMKEE